MKQMNDSIQFDSKMEVNELLDTIVRYVKAFPQEKNNSTLKGFYRILEKIEMEW